MRILAVVVAFHPLIGPHVDAATKWTQVRTPHYLLIGDARAAVTVRAAQGAGHRRRRAEQTSTLQRT